MGDIILLGLVFRNLRLHWPKAHIVLLTQPAYVSAAALHADINQILSLTGKARERLQLLSELRRARFTHVLDYDNATTTSLFTWLSRAPVRATYERCGGCNVRRAWMYTTIARIPARDYHTLHISEASLSLLSSIGVPIRTRVPSLTLSAADIARVHKFSPRPPAPDARGAPQKNRARLLIHPGASSPARVWPLERFAAACDQLASRLGVHVFLVAGPNERDAAHSIRAASQTAPAIIDETLSVGEFAALCRHFDLVLCNDSGPMHIAACIGTPVVALFGAQNAILWGPIGSGHTILQTPRPCTCLCETPQPCVRSQNPDQSYCVRMLSVEQVVDAVQQALQKRLT